MLIICVLQVSAVGVAEGPESPPGGTADYGTVGHHGCGGVVSLNSPLASAPIIHPDVDTSDVVVAERGVFVVPCLVHGSHSVVELVKHVPEQQGEVTLLVKRGVDALQLPFVLAGRHPGRLHHPHHLLGPLGPLGLLQLVQVLELLEQKVQMAVLDLHRLISPEAPLMHRSLLTCLHGSSRRIGCSLLRLHHLGLLQWRPVLEPQLRNRPMAELDLRVLVLATAVVAACSHPHQLP